MGVLVDAWRASPPTPIPSQRGGGGKLLTTRRAFFRHRHGGAFHQTSTHSPPSPSWGGPGEGAALNDHMIRKAA